MANIRCARIAANVANVEACDMTHHQKVVRAIAIFIMGLTALICVHTADYRDKQADALQCGHEICRHVPR